MYEVRIIQYLVTVFARCDFNPLIIQTIFDGMAASSKVTYSFELNLSVMQLDKLKLVP
jgi:hypothetical protein